MDAHRPLFHAQDHVADRSSGRTKASSDASTGEKQLSFVAPEQLEPRALDALIALIRERTGIQISAAKRQLLGRRGAARRAELNLDTDHYLALVREEGGEFERLISVITTNHTSFFRERHHFELMREAVIPAWRAKAARGDADRFRLWSAGCATGEEPYSLAMSVMPVLPRLDPWDWRILATDIDPAALQTGEAGRYAWSALADAPEDARTAFVHRPDADTAQMRAPLRDAVVFRRMNLMEPWPMKGKFDVIFCRNVMIYFDNDTNHTLLNRFIALLHPGGWLFAGHAEAFVADHPQLISRGRTAYMKRAGA